MLRWLRIDQEIFFLGMCNCRVFFGGFRAPPFVRSCFLTKISISIQKGNARAIRKHLTVLKSHKYFEVDHHLPEYLQLEEF
jgi:hypothetical protein